MHYNGGPKRNEKTWRNQPCWKNGTDHTGVLRKKIMYRFRQFKHTLIYVRENATYFR